MRATDTAAWGMCMQLCAIGREHGKATNALSRSTLMMHGHITGSGLSTKLKIKLRRRYNTTSEWRNWNRRKWLVIAIAATLTVLLADMNKLSKATAAQLR